MAITTNALPSEFHSNYFKLNEEFCTAFEDFIIAHKGKVKGSYNAWTYLVHGHISEPKKWYLTYQKSTLTSSGNILLSSKKQSVLSRAQWEIKLEATDSTLNEHFLIRRVALTDRIQKVINSSLVNLENYKGYVINTKNSNSKLILKLTNILKPLFESKEIFAISYNKNILSIELRTEQHHFEVFKQLITL